MRVHERNGAHVLRSKVSSPLSTRLGFVAEVRHLPLAAADLRCIWQAAPQEDLHLRTRRSGQVTAAAPRWSSTCLRDPLANVSCSARPLSL
jgi:hypothetical protein